MFKRPHLPAICAAALIAATGAASAQAWPTKPIRVIVPYAAGGPADVIARLVAKKAGDTLGQTVIVDNKGGAGGTIGVDAALKSAPDGYTFALTAQGPLAGMPNLMKAPYAIADIQYLTLVARGPAVVAVAKKVPAATLPDFIKLAKAQPGKLNYGSAGPGTTPHIAGELLKDEAGIEMTHVPYKGAGPAVTGLLGGEIDVAVVDLLNVLPHVAAGNLKVLAVASPSRAPQLPNVPTTKEAGLPNLVMDTNYGVIAPAGIPADVLNKFRDAIVAAVQSSDLKDQMVKLGVVPVTSTAQDYKAATQAESDKWKRVISTAKITLE
jgi:tripartite-type tricarboxylate transporter receptor subunit TctC